MGSLFSNNVETITGFPISTISEVRKGKSTEVLLKAGDSVDPNCSLSIINNERTIDLTTFSPGDRDLFISALKALCEKNNSHHVIFR